MRQCIELKMSAGASTDGVTMIHYDLIAEAGEGLGARTLLVEEIRGFRALFVPMSLLFFYVCSIFFRDLSLADSVYLAVVSNHCVLAVMAFLQRVHTTFEQAKMIHFVFNPRIRENFYKGALFSLPGAEIHFVLDAGVGNIFARTCSSPLIANTAILQSLEGD